MQFIKNLKISNKLILLVIISSVVITSIIMVSSIGLNTVSNMLDETYNTISVPTGYIIQIRDAVARSNNDIRDIGITTDESENKRLETSISGDISDLKAAVGKYESYLKEYKVTSGEEYDKFQQIKANIDPFISALNEAVAVAMTNDQNKTVQLINNNVAPKGKLVTNAVMELAQINIQQSADANDASTKIAFNASLQMTIVSIFGFAFLFLFALFIIRSITRPAKQMVEVAQNVAKGNLNVNVKVDSKDEMGVLAGEFLTLINTLRNLVDDLFLVAKEHGELGNTDSHIDIKKYDGAYRDLASGLNAVLDDYVNGTTAILNCVGGFGDGDFDVTIKKFPGKKAAINDMIEALRANMKAVGKDIAGLINSASNGNLNEHADAARYKGDWARIVEGLNQLMVTINEPIQESVAVMQKLAMGDFSEKVSGQYKGDFVLIKTALNNTIANMSVYIKEIAEVLSAMASNDFNQEIRREYVGEFTNIKLAVNSIIDKLNNVFQDIHAASEQVSTGAKQLSESSMTLAQGATEQASSVEELNASIDTINEQTQRNAEKADKANLISNVSMDNATKGNSEMKHMLDAMDGIKESSGNIAKIIKVIEDIAFQTNLLALNAAVEAARAGEHGKGFAVVAEEVRSLAARSQKAAQETTELIENSVSRVNDGTKIATATADALSMIVSDVKEVSGIIKEIAEASKEQASAIKEVSIGLGQISQVVQNNSATSEESASASQEMASQADTLESMVAVFKLRN